MCDIIDVQKAENYKENQGFLLPLDKKGEPTADNDPYSWPLNIDSSQECKTAMK